MCPSSGRSHKSAAWQRRASHARVRPGHDPVLATMHDEDRRFYLPGVKPPRGHEGQFVVQHAAWASLDGLPGDAAQPRPWAQEGLLISGGELLRVELGRRQVIRERATPPGRGAQQRHAAGRHAGEPVQLLGVERSQPGNAGHAEDTFRKQGAAGQGVRATAGMTHDGELADAQRVRDTGDVEGR